MLALALTLALAAPPPKADRPGEGAPDVSGRPAAAQLLDSPAQVRSLCEALAPSGRLLTRGDVVDRARAEAAHEDRREVALAARYRVVIAADRLRFAEYDPDEQRLALSERTFLGAASGTIQVWPVEEAGLPVTVEVGAARRIMKAAARKTLTLALTFTLPDDDDDVTCGHANGSQRYSLGVEPFRWEYLDGGRVLARGGEGSDRPIVTAAEGARPRVRVSDPLGGGREIRSAVEGRAKDLENCYQRALQGNPGLDGSLVAEVDLAGGAARSVRMAADSLQDEAMTGCVTGIISHVSFPQGGDVLADIPIHFELEPPAVDSGAGAERR